jgi:hypothetical protein
MPFQQGQHLAGMISQATNAWGSELDSRVAQMREIRRMEHEKEMEILRQQEDRMRQETALKKIAAEQGMAIMQMKMRDAMERGDESKTLVNGRWVPSWMM